MGAAVLLAVGLGGTGGIGGMGGMDGASMTSALRLRGRNLLQWHHQFLHLQEDTLEDVEVSVPQEEESLESGPERELSLEDAPVKHE